jgi:hypothetical protein
VSKYLTKVCSGDDEGVVKDVDLAVLEADGLVVAIRHQRLPDPAKGRGVVQRNVAGVLKMDELETEIILEE